MTEAVTTILVIEDDDALRSSIEDYLGDRGFRVLLAENGRVGLEIFDRTRPDLILTDLRMPEVGGLEILRLVQERSPETPLIVVSGTGNISDSAQALQFGAWDYILKPVEDMSIILHAVERALDRARLLRENRDYQENLKTLVRDRTKELEQANATLTAINLRLRKVVESARRLATTRKVADLGPALLHELREHTQATGGSIYLSEGDGLRLLSSLDPDHALDFIPYPLQADSILDRAMKEKKALWIQDVAKDLDTASNGLGGYRDGSVLAFPIPNERGENVGVLTLYNKSPSLFVEQDREIGAILASYGSETLRATRAVENLLASETRFRELVESLPEGIFEMGLDLNLNYANKRTLELFGYRAEDIADNFSATNLVVENDRDRVREDLAKRTRGELFGAVQYSAQRKDGSTFPILVSVDSICVDGETTGFRGVVVDITKRIESEREKRQLEEQLRQSQKMEAVGALAAGVAHDLNNVLTAVMGYTDLTRMVVGENEEAIDLLAEVSRAVDHATGVTSSLLTFSRKAPAKRCPILLSAIVRDGVSMLRHILPASIDVQTKFAEPDLCISGDFTQIQQIVLNLAINARDAMPKGGELRLTVEHRSAPQSDLQPDEDPAELNLGEGVLTVKDSGEGIPPDVLERIFEPFFTTKPSEEGTGLGMSIVYGIVREHGGRIDIDSELGMGTCITVSFPICESDSPAAIESARSHASSSGETLLLAEDNRQVRGIIVGALKSAGYRVRQAGDGSEALDVFEAFRHEVDMCIFDLDMPRVGGLECLDRVRRVSPTMPILLISSSVETKVQDGLPDGVEILSKPFGMVDLLDKVEHCLHEPTARP